MLEIIFNKDLDSEKTYAIQSYAEFYNVHLFPEKRFCLQIRKTLENTEAETMATVFKDILNNYTIQTIDIYKDDDHALCGHYTYSEIYQCITQVNYDPSYPFVKFGLLTIQ